MQKIEDIKEDRILFPVSRGLFTVIDAEDLAKVKCWSWFAIPSGRTKWRVRGRVEGKFIYLHRYLLGLSEFDSEIDHWNRDGLDNRKKNLRPITRRGNLLNRGLDPRNRSGYRGVSQHPKSRRWVANGWRNYKQFYLGCFDTPKEASIVVEEFYAKD